MLLKWIGKYYHLDKNGYILESGLANPGVLLIKGMVSDFENIPIGGRVEDEDIKKFTDIIKITDGIKNNNINANLTSIDIADDKNLVLEFTEENKTIVLGNTSDLSAKMEWINFFIEQNKGEKGTVHLNSEEVYYSPN